MSGQQKMRNGSLFDAGLQLKAAGNVIQTAFCKLYILEIVKVFNILAESYIYSYSYRVGG